MMSKITLTGPQYDFITSEARNPAMIAGYAAGKTEAAIIRLFKKKRENPRQDVAYYLPTYDLINTIALPRMEAFMANNGIRHKINKSDKMIHIPGFGKIILRTMDNPERIVGYEVADSIADEIDVLPMDKARDVWQKIIARNRQKKDNGEKNTAAIATTPEGYRFTYDRWKRRGNENYQIIKASTYSNAHNLPDGYIQSLEEEYPEQLLKAYLHGDFVNLSFQSVYSEFDRVRNATDRAVREGELLHIGMDFNVGKMAAGVFIVDDNKAHGVDEFLNYLDTPEIIRAIKGRYPGHLIYVYPDATGGSRHTQNASESDIALLEAAGFVVNADKKNPFVRDRILAVNSKLKKGEMLINIEKCPKMTEALEQQSYNERSEPDKTTGHDHINDAIGYFIHYRFPITSYGVSNMEVWGV